MKNNLFRLGNAMVVVIAATLLSQRVSAQGLPEGECIQGQATYHSFDEGGDIKTVFYTRTTVYIISSIGFSMPIYTAPTGKYIVSVREKIPYLQGYLIVTLDDGSIAILAMTLNGPDDVIATPRKFTGPTEGFESAFKKLAGDAMYALTYSSKLYVSRDTAATWQADSSGLNGSSVRDFDLDTLQFVYAATSTGLYKQYPDSITWRRVTSFPTTKPLSSVFVDRRNRIYVGSDSLGPYCSTDNGVSWTNATTGIGSATVGSFGDDRHGNVYAISSAGLHLWRLSGGTGGWMQVDQSLVSQSADPANPGAFGFVQPFFTAIGGDSIVTASTAIGNFRSADQGSTWTLSNSGLSTDNPYGFVRLPTGRLVASTSMGTFYKNPNGSIWTKSFPTNGYLQGSYISRDNSGSLYIRGARLDLNSSTSPKTIWKSTDNGTTWSQDVTGLSGVPQDGTFFVDETGGQHLTYLGGGTANFYSKPAGGSWVSDAAGIAISGLFGGGSSIGSDGKGTLFAFAGGYVPSGLVWKRPVAGGIWTLDTTGIGSNWITQATHDKQGNMIAGAYNRGIYRNTSGVWSKLGLPSLLAATQILALSVDSTNAIYAAFQGNDVNGNYRYLGVYSSKDNGSTWKLAGLDSTQVTSMISYGDSTFALTDRGVYLLRSTSFAQAQLSTKNVSFGSIRVGQVSDVTVNITNVGNDTLKIGSITSTSALFSARPTSRTVPPGQSFTDTLRFAPSVLGVLSANIVVTSNSSSSPDTIRLSGTGIILTALAQLNTKTLAFGNVHVGQPKDTTVTINNSGSDTLRITSVTSTSAIFSARPSSRTVAPGQSFSDTIRFTPSSAGTVSGSIILTSNSTSSPDTIRVSGAGAVASAVERLGGIPTESSLGQNYPNPFNPTTTIQYSIPTRSRTRLGVYDILGRLVATLVDEEQAPAYYMARWNASAAPSGVYFVRIQAGSYVETKKMVLLR